jgi:cystathionine beta-lyase
MYNFDKTLDRVNTNCTKWDALLRDYSDPNLLPMWIADTDFEVPPELNEALKNRINHATYGYTFAGDNYFESVIRWNQRRNDFLIKKEEIIPLPGVLCSLGFIIAALSEKGDKLLINPPVYGPFFDIVLNSERNLIVSPLKQIKDKYCIDFEDLETKLKEGVKLYLLCSPHNPVGRVWEMEELQKIVELCDRYGTLIASDEIHSDLVYSGHKHVPITKISDKAKEIAIIATAPTKTFNICGLKVSNLICHNPILREKIKKNISRYHLSVNLFGYIATEAAYNHGDKWLNELLVYLEENAKFTQGFIHKKIPRIKTYLPQGTYLMWLDFSDYEYEQEKLMQIIQQRAGIALNDGTQFGKEGTGFARMNIGTTRLLLARALDKLADVFTNQI